MHSEGKEGVYKTPVHERKEKDLWMKWLASTRSRTTATPLCTCLLGMHLFIKSTEVWRAIQAAEVYISRTIFIWIWHEWSKCWHATSKCDTHTKKTLQLTVSEEAQKERIITEQKKDLKYSAKKPPLLDDVARGK